MMFTIEQLRELRDNFGATEQTDLFRKLIMSHLDADHGLEQKNAEIETWKARTEDLYRRLREIKTMADTSGGF